MRLGFILTIAIALLVTGGCNDDEELNGCIDPKKIDPQAACIEIYQPVCGCDGNTYENECFAEISGIKSWIEGACQD